MLRPLSDDARYHPSMSSATSLPRSTNQALGIGQYAIDFMSSGSPSAAVRRRTALFHTDSVLCGLSALALGTQAPTILRKEALDYPDANGATPFGSDVRVKAEKAIVANSSAVREWDSNGTNFGYNPALGHTAGEFGHNDFYPVAVAACQQRGLDGAAALRAMILIDEIRGRLAEVFSLKTYKIDHVVHGAIGSAAAYGAVMGATAEQIESAIGMFVAHYTPWRAIRAGKQLSDSKGASAAISTEAAILCMKRAMNGFLGPKDIFRNPESLFRQFIKTSGDSPFDLVLSNSGDDFAVMGMHFKLGLYEHQSAGALQAVVDLLSANPELRNPENIAKVTVVAYEPAFGIIGDPAKRDPRTRQSADHSMVYIVATLMRKAQSFTGGDLWMETMLTPYDYSEEAVLNSETRAIMEKIAFEHGGETYDSKYPEGIPTSVVIETTDGKIYDSELVMFPTGHARNESGNLAPMLEAKFKMLGEIAFDGDARAHVERLNDIESLSSAELAGLYALPYVARPGYRG